MVVKDATVKYRDCTNCKASVCISSYQPGPFMNLNALHRSITKRCTKCGMVLGIKSVQIKFVKKGQIYGHI